LIFFLFNNLLFCLLKSDELKKKNYKIENFFNSFNFKDPLKKDYLIHLFLKNINNQEIKILYSFSKNRNVSSK
jgi:hypothetical protein